MSVQRAYSLANGARIPSVGYGTWTVFLAAKGAICEGLKVAIAEGYRHVDCAWVYDNEEEVGDAIEAKIKDGTIKREDIFVTTKLWNTAHRREAVMEQLKHALKKLRLDFVDLYLMHWPMSFKEGEENFPKGEDGSILFENHDITDTWKGMEDVYDAGLTRNIGLSNFNSLQTQNILDTARIKPCMMQIEINPTFSNSKMVNFCKERGMLVTAYAPLGNPNRPWFDSKDPVLLEDAIVKEIATSKGKTPAQVCLRFLLQRGLIIIPKSVTPSRIRENIELYDFELSDDEMNKICSLNTDFRAYAEPIAVDHPAYPFNVDF